MSFTAHIDNKKNTYQYQEIGPTQGFEHTLTAEKMYSINFTVTKIKILFKFALYWTKQSFIC